MPYRILMVAPTSFFGDYGCHVRILEETLALQKLGHQVLIVTYPRGRDLPNVCIERTIPVPWRVDYEVGSSRHKIALDLLLIPRVLRAARRFKPDLVHAHLHEGALIGAFVARLFNIPLVFDFQGSLTGEMVDHHFLNPRGIFYRPMRSLERVIDQLPQAVLTSGPHQARGLAADFGISPQKIFHIADAVNPSWFRPRVQTERGEHPAPIMRLKRFLGIPPHRPVVVYLGLLADYQGVGLLLEAAAQVLAHGTDAHFVIMGYPGAERYALRAQQLGIASRVSLPGRIPYDDAPAWLAVGDIAVAPKLSATEGNGKILNYMASGLPVVAFDNPVSREYLGDEGIYAPPGDVHALAVGLEALLCDPPRARELGWRLRARAIEKFAWDHAAHKIEQVYAAALQARAPSHFLAPEPTPRAQPKSPHAE
jgi:glycosyltransferase involved in cell wall biosynthesis